ncbi:hypothetical protein FSP39_004074 [Pinctada imbricata]|uniref:Fork-head domain-containing protein n=1 Tax=Pinctada imbricata TaxID=66713 RepID=A0AA89C530_PINIB|nr:hypothetical protein FSP39_004074 [Pinctada imbricata]
MMNRYEMSRFDSRDISPFYSSFPPPFFMRTPPNGVYDGRMDLMEHSVWKDRKDDPKMFPKYHPEFSHKLLHHNGISDLYDRERKLYDVNHKGDVRNRRDLTEKKGSSYPGAMLELDVTSPHVRNSVKEQSPISPSEYFYRRRDILSNSGSSHSTSPVSPFSPEQSCGKLKYPSSRNLSGPPSPPRSHGIMERSEAGVINLSTTKDVVSEHMMNGEISQNGDLESAQDVAPSSPNGSKVPPTNETSPGAPSNGVAAKRKTKCNSAVELGSPPQPLMMMAAQQGLLQQHVQQMMQGQGLTTPQIQQLLQHQTMLQHQQQQKLHEQMLQELNEQLQMNVIQQSQLMQQQDKSKGSKAQQQLQQLSVQQQQLIQQIQQIQLQQRQYLLACLVSPFGMQQGMMLHPELQQLWKEVASQSGADPENGVKGGFNGLGSTVSTPSTQAPSAWTNGLNSNYLPAGLIGQPPVAVDVDNAERKNAILFRHGVCKWPGCDTPCEDQAAFHKHLNIEHQLDDRSTAQARVQMQVVSQLEIQLTRERDLLQGMMLHLHMKKPADPTLDTSTAQKLVSQKMSSPVSPVSMTTLHSAPSSPPKPASIISSPLKLQPSMTTISSVSAPPTPVALVSNPMSLPLGIAPPPSMSKPPTPLSQASQPATPTGGGGPMRRRVSDKSNLPISSGTSEEIQRNRDFYKSTDVRPPFTYASLIRQAIIESPHKQLTLNEIYQWFQSTFAYFRRNEATWKNAVRHNLSLHKCFMRVENVKGAVWTVDEVEFYKRRPQKLGGNMPIKDIKSPMIPDPMFGENLNASLRAALEQANLLNHHYSNGTVPMDGVEDLSMKSNRTSSSDYHKDTSPSQDGYPDVKDEASYEEEEAFLRNGQMAVTMEMRTTPPSDSVVLNLQSSSLDCVVKEEASEDGQQVFSENIAAERAVVLQQSPNEHYLRTEEQYITEERPNSHDEGRISPDQGRISPNQGRLSPSQDMYLSINKQGEPGISCIPEALSS